LTEERTITLEFTEDEIRKIREYQVLEEIPGSLEDVTAHLLTKAFKHMEDTMDMSQSEETIYTLKKIIAKIANGPKDRFCQ
jgi:hypothetical protein